jgi:hypothetical protein
MKKMILFQKENGIDILEKKEENMFFKRFFSGCVDGMH